MAEIPVITKVRKAGPAADALRDYFSGRPVLAFKFGDGRNKSFSRLRNFVSYPTLLYADFPLPRLDWLKPLAAAGFVISLALACVLLLARRRLL